MSDRPRTLGSLLAGVALALLTSLAACEDAGVGVVVFDVAFETPPTEPLFLRAAVEARGDDPDEAGTVLASAGPVQWIPGGGGAQLQMPGLQEGKQRVIVVEARASASPFDRVRYYGLSEPFAIVAGRRTTVPVRLALAQPEPDRAGIDLALIFGGEPRTRVTADVLSDATVRVVSAGARELTVANDAAFSLGVARLAVDDARIDCTDVPDPDDAARTLQQCDIANWDLSDGLPEDLGDGVYTVFVRLVDDRGYESAVASTSVSRDSVAPALLGTPLFEVTPSDPRARISQNAVWAGEDAVVTATFALSEALAALPEVSADGPDGPLVAAADLTVEADPDTDNLYRLTLVNPTGEGTSDVVASVRDVAGNPATIRLGEVRWDVSAPAALDVARQDAVRLIRVPWGSDATAGDVVTELRICPGHDFCADDTSPPFEAGALLTVLTTQTAEDGSPRCDTTPLAEATVPDDPGGRMTVPLVTNLPAVCITVTDRALNTSPAALVRDVDWTATLGGKRVGSTVENPHTVTALARLEPTLRQRSDVAIPLVQAQVDAIARTDDAALRARAERTWRRRDVSVEAPPDFRTGTFGAWDPATGLTYAFGGGTFLASDSRLRTWDGRRWRTVAPASGVAPPGLSSPSVTVDVARGEVLVFGGRPPQTQRPDCRVWAFDGERWTDRTPGDGEAPAARDHHRMVHLTGTGTSLLYGGRNSLTRAMDDTWLWDGDTWTRVGTMGPKPPRRHSHAMTYDAARERVVLFGGCSGEVTADPCAAGRADTWEWDGSAWSLVADAASGPGGKDAPHLVYDAARERVLLFDAASNDVWVWDGASWINITPSGLQPSIEMGGFAVYDAVRDRLVVSGQRLSIEAPQTLEYDGQRWRDVTPTGIAPPSDGGVALAHDADTDVTFAFGGQRADFTVSDALLAWNGHQWRVLDPGGAGPSPRRDAQLVATGAGTALLMGGCEAPNVSVADVMCAPAPPELWRWDGAVWTEIVPADGQLWPEALVDQRMTWDDDRQTAVLFGGCEPRDDDIDGCRSFPFGSPDLDKPWLFHPDDLWEFADGVWTKTVSPPDLHIGRTDHGLSWNAATGAIVVGPGNGFQSLGLDTSKTTYSWLEGTWNAGPELFARSYAQVYDSVRARVIAIGSGSLLGSAPAFELRGGAWHDLTTAFNAPTANTIFDDGAYERAEGEIVVLGGISPDKQVWGWDASASLRSGVVVAIDWSAASALVSALRGLRVDAVAGARGAALAADGGVGEARAGVVMSAWDASEGAWQVLALGDHDLDASGSLAWQSAEGASAATWIPVGTRTLTLMLRPEFAAGNGAALPAVDVDYIEVTASYQTCVADCSGLQCGGDGCGGSCGTCDSAAPHCNDGTCSAEPPACVPACPEGACGDDGCGGQCPTCGDYRACVDGWCTAAVTDGCELPTTDTCPDNANRTCRTTCDGDTLMRCIDETTVRVDCRALGGACAPEANIGHGCGGCAGLEEPRCVGPALLARCQGGAPLYIACGGYCQDGECFDGGAFNDTCEDRCGERSSLGLCGCDRYCAQAGDCCSNMGERCGYCD